MTSKGLVPQQIWTNGLTATEAVKVMKAFQALGFPLTLEITITKDTNLPTNHIAQAPLASGTFFRPCAIDVRPELFDTNEHDLKGVIWHEYGHCAGLNHSPYLGQIMYYQETGSFDLYAPSEVLNFRREVCKLTKSWDCP